MKVNNIKSVLCAATALVALSSCELDQYPVGTLTNDQAWETFDGAERNYNGLLVSLRSMSGGAYQYLSDLQTDLFNERVTCASYNQINEWTFTSSLFDGDAIWSANYSLILQANDLLEHLPKFMGAGTAKAQLAKGYYYRGAAYFSRAYAYTNLLTKYCDRYDEATAGTALGLPIVEAVSAEAKPARSTMAYTCKYIQDCLDSAKVNFERGMTLGYDNTSIGSSAVHQPGYDAAIALNARFAINTKQYDLAIDQAQRVIDSYPLTTASGMETMLRLDKSNEIIYEPIQTDEEQGQSWGAFIGYDIRSMKDEDGSTYYDLYGYNPSYLPTKNFMDLFSSDDVRRDLYFVCPWFGGSWDSDYKISGRGDVRDSGHGFWKFSGGNNDILKESQKGYYYAYPYNMAKPFRSAELYLIIAEASLLKSTPDEEQAQFFLTQLRSNRMTSDADVTETGNDLKQLMMDEWAREFAGEGFRFDCLKRWNVGFERKPQIFNETILSGKADELKITADNFRWTWEIPQQERQTNPNIVSNWGGR